MLADTPAPAAALPFTPLGLGLLWALPLAARFLPGPGAVGADLRLRAILIASPVAGVLAAPFSVILLFTLDMASNPFLAAGAGVLLLAAFQTVAGLMVMLRAPWFGGLQGLPLERRHHPGEHPDPERRRRRLPSSAWSFD